MLDFLYKLRQIQESRRSVLCVGLDPDPQRMPQHVLDLYPLPEAIEAFNAAIIEAVGPAACAFKLNLAFYEVLGWQGWRALEATLALIPEDTITLADAKRGDIGNTGRMYAEALFETLGFDACTVAPYMGRDSVAPFLEYPGKAAFVLARTSNPGAADFQERDCEGEPLYLRVARQVAAWNEGTPGAAGLVVGATAPEALAEVRATCPTLPFLVPGVGAQGGDPGAVMRTAATDDGLVLVNSSRQILYASDGEDFAEAAAREAEKLRAALDNEK